MESRLVHVNQLYAPFLYENISYERSDTISLNPPCPSSQLLLDVPATRFVPSHPARTRKILQIPQTNLSLPSFTYPLGSCHCVNVVGFVCIRIKLVRWEAFEKALGRRRAVFA
jgi:hypothetical protein